MRVPVVVVGGFNAPEQIEDAIASGKCGFAAMGRQQLADPEFVNKTLEGRDDQIAPCLRCSCFNPLDPDPDKRPIPELWHCAVNPWGQRELRWRNAPRPAASRNVVVVGGGVSGMYAAATACLSAATRLRSSSRGAALGGQLMFTDIDTDKESLRRFKDSLIARCKFQNVDIRLNTKATRELLSNMKPDYVICAVGAHPFVPAIRHRKRPAHPIRLHAPRRGEGQKGGHHRRGSYRLRVRVLLCERVGRASRHL